MKENDIIYTYIDKELYYIVLFTIDNIKFYSLVDKEECEPFVIKTLTHGFTDTFSYNDEDDYKSISHNMSVNYYELYSNLKSFFLSLNNDNFTLGIPLKEGYYLIKEDNNFKKVFINEEKISNLKKDKCNILYSFIL